MFADSVLESSWAQRSRRSWTTLSSFGLQALLLVLLMLLPILKPVALPFLKPLSAPVSLAPFRGVPLAPQMSHATAPVTSNFSNHVLMEPSRIPILVQNPSEPEAPPQAGPSGPYIPGTTGLGGDPNGVLNGITNIGNTVAPQPPPPVVHQLRISHMMEGNLLVRVQPVYPQIARNARVQGRVVLAAVISKDGAIENLRVIEGHPMLVNAAIEAVKQWRYRPYVLNNEPVEVETQVTVNFLLSGS
jgi:periplasmic protein TonB